MKLKVTQQTDSGLNIKFVNTESGRQIGLEHAINQINNGNPNYSGYSAITNPDGVTYIRSKPDGSTKNNIE